MTTVLIARPLWPVLRRIVPLLRAEGYQVEETPSWSRLLDAELPSAELAGIFLGDHGEVAEEASLVQAFRQRTGVQGIPVILVGGMNALGRDRRFRTAGVDLVLPADLDAETLVERTAPLLHYGSLCQSLAEANRSLRDRAMLDELTGLPDRRHFSQDAARSVEMARRIGRPLSCILIDIDDFKKVNDSFGQAAGDEVIRQFGSVMNKGRRAYDIVARVGGDEFAWLLVDADAQQALKAASRAHGVVRENVFLLDPASPIRLTATFGVATVVPGGELSLEDLVGNADRALYWGKESGKNTVKFYPNGKGNPGAAADTHIS